jgi:long-chain acyl-CoA synthetase
VAAASFQSFPAMFLHRIQATPDSDALYYPDAHEEWKTLRWKEVGERVRAIACGLRALGLAPEERASIISNTRYDWILIDIAIGCARGATTTIYPSTTTDGVEYILKDSETKVVFAEDASQVKKLTEIRANTPGVTKVVVMSGNGGHDGWVITLSELEELGRQWDKDNAGAYEAGIREVQPDHIATLIYTSGTTGEPKGVVLTNDCWVFEGEAMNNLGFLTPADKQFLWLPLSHSFGKVLEAAIIRIGVPTAVDGRIDRIVENLGKVRPTFVAAVPRIFEKVYNKVVSGAKEGGKLKWKIFQWAVGVGKEVSQQRQAGRQPTGALALKYSVADKLVFSKLRDRFGGRLRFFISGSAPLNRELAEFFHAANILIVEGYGLTETSAASFVNRPDKFKFGTVGLGLPGVEVKLDPDTSEILLQSRGVMRGYHNKPQASAETLFTDASGTWLRTGDKGEIDPDGFLRITDRIKDLIKTSGGKYIAPQALEGNLKNKSTLIEQVLVHGNNRNFCSALITLNLEAAQKWATDNGKGELSVAQLAKDPDLNAEIQRAINALNEGLARYETIKKFAILPRDFTIEGGELTPSMKVKRKTVEAMYKDLLEGFYAGAKED